MPNSGCCKTVYYTLNCISLKGGEDHSEPPRQSHLVRAERRLFPGPGWPAARLRCTQIAQSVLSPARQSAVLGPLTGSAPTCATERSWKTTSIEGRPRRSSDRLRGVYARRDGVTFKGGPLACPEAALVVGLAPPGLSLTLSRSSGSRDPTVKISRTILAAAARRPRSRDQMAGSSTPTKMAANTTPTRNTAPWARSTVSAMTAVWIRVSLVGRMAASLHSLLGL